MLKSKINSMSVNGIMSIGVIVVMLGFFITLFFASEGHKAIAVEKDKLQIIGNQSAEYTSIEVEDVNELVTIGEDKYYVDEDGKLMVGYLLDGEFKGKATTEEETMSYVEYLYDNGELEVPNAWAVTELEGLSLTYIAVLAAPSVLFGVLLAILEDKEEN